MFSKVIISILSLLLITVSLSFATTVPDITMGKFFIPNMANLNFSNISIILMIGISLILLIMGILFTTLESYSKVDKLLSFLKTGGSPEKYEKLDNSSKEVVRLIQNMPQPVKQTQGIELPSLTSLTTVSKSNSQIITKVPVAPKPPIAPPKAPPAKVVEKSIPKAKVVEKSISEAKIITEKPIKEAKIVTPTPIDDPFSDAFSSVDELFEKPIKENDDFDEQKTSIGAAPDFEEMFNEPKKEKSPDNPFDFSTKTEEEKKLDGFGSANLLNDDEVSSFYDEKSSSDDNSEKVENNYENFEDSFLNDLDSSSNSSSNSFVSSSKSSDNFGASSSFDENYKEDNAIFDAEDDEDEDELNTAATMIASVPETLLEKSRLEDPDKYYKKTYKDFYDMKTANGEVTQGLSEENFVIKLKKTEKSLQAQKGCKWVEFSVYNKSGKISLKATPKY